MKAPMLALACVLVVAGCEREARRFTDSAASAAPAHATPAKSPYEDNAYAVSQGQRLYAAFNCSGCHAHGGGNIGPALMDDKWIYGHEPANIYASIVEGRPNGMPSFGGRIPEAQVWQIVAYVRSMSGQLGSATAPGRTDSMKAAEPESTREREKPRQVTTPQ